ncbi:MAG: peptide-methionine (S)-S-oxide reductase [Acidimicrobiaceae bacterium]|jgi:peptide-methionine (S)-S-oxide reductase|nr:peptide-methionine (S)-S-oxide reductase [Acidimicrobiaceae bacterium]|tara:strand:+ start:9853 stop:10491 length:639 start_codon:yes stop_codon:yes gene_type:complete
MRNKDMFLPQMPNEEMALPGRTDEMTITENHYVLGSSQIDPLGDNLVSAMFGMGCFWGAERKFWVLDGVITTSVGYASGFTPNPLYEEVCSGMTGHNEVVRVVFDSKLLSYKSLLKTFWENHNPTQGMRQGNDIGTQYRSGLYCFSQDQYEEAEESRSVFQLTLTEQGFGEITTEILLAPTFYFAEDYHQQYLGKNPHGYCGLGGTGLTCSI